MAVRGRRTYLVPAQRHCRIQHVSKADRKASNCFANTSRALTYSLGKSPIAKTQLPCVSGEGGTMAGEYRQALIRAPSRTHSNDVLPHAPSPTMTSLRRICEAGESECECE